MPYKVRKGVPLPDDLASQEGAERKLGRPWKYPWREMEPGDSTFFASRDDGKEVFRSSLSHWKRTHPDQRWIIRRVEGTGIRIWRME